MCLDSAFFDTEEENRHFCSLVTSVTYVTRLNGYGGSLGDASRQIENDGAKPSIGHKKMREANYHVWRDNSCRSSVVACCRLPGPPDIDSIIQWPPFTPPHLSSGGAVWLFCGYSAESPVELVDHGDCLCVTVGSRWTGSTDIIFSLISEKRQLQRCQTTDISLSGHPDGRGFFAVFKFTFVCTYRVTMY